MTQKYQYIDWNQIYELCLKVYRQVRENGYIPDVIVGVARGGWVPARILADFFVTSHTANVKVEFYQGIYETIETPHISQPISGEPRWKRVLLVDDISDTGSSLKAVIEHLERYKVAELRSVCLHVKPWTEPLPNFYVKSTDAWVIYPWELKEFIFAQAQQMKDEGKSEKEIKLSLQNFGLPPRPLKEFLDEWSQR
ncbi:MAG: phosphoribosyltransferase [Candidatus Odinarchaeota archaeon]